MTLDNNTNFKNKEDIIKHLKQQGVYRNEFKPIFVSNLKTNKSKIIDAVGIPIFKLNISNGQKTTAVADCFLDTGSPFSIYNPSKNETINNDKIFKQFFDKKSDNPESLVMQGVGGGIITSQETLKFCFEFGKIHVETEIVVLPRHEPTLPKLLLGQRARVI